MYDSLRISLGLPIGTPEWMVYAMADAIAKKNAESITKIVDPRQNTIREKIRVAPGNTARLLLEKCWFQIQNGVYLDFLDKNVLDIGGWFGGIAPILSNSASHITVVDPIFKEKNLESLYLKDLKNMENHIHFQFEDNGPITPELARRREKNAVNSKKVYEEVLWWKTYDPAGIHNHIQRNPSYGENLVWIPGSSQDYIFVNYVLLKTTVRQIEFLDEMNRVLKTDWQIIISDYEMPQEVLSMIRSRFIDIRIVQNNEGRFIVMGRKR